MSLDSLLNATCAVQRQANTKDPSGSAKPNFATVPGLEAVRCGVQAKTGRFVKTLGQRQVFVSHHFYFAYKVPVQRGDVLLSGGLTYLVHGFEDMGGRGVAYRAECTLET